MLLFVAGLSFKYFGFLKAEQLLFVRLKMIHKMIIYESKIIKKVKDHL